MATLSSFRANSCPMQFLEGRREEEEGRKEGGREGEWYQATPNATHLGPAEKATKACGGRFLEFSGVNRKGLNS